MCIKSYFVPSQTCLRYDGLAGSRRAPSRSGTATTCRRRRWPPSGVPPRRTRKESRKRGGESARNGTLCWTAWKIPGWASSRIEIRTTRIKRKTKTRRSCNSVPCANWTSMAWPETNFVDRSVNQIWKRSSRRRKLRQRGKGGRNRRADYLIESSKRIAPRSWVFDHPLVRRWQLCPMT